MRNYIKELKAIEEEFEDDEIILEDYNPEEKDYTVLEVFAGTGVISVITGIILLLLSDDKLYDVTGFVIGVAISLFMVWHMDRSVLNAMDMPEEAIKGYITRKYVLRLLVVLAAMTAVAISGAGNILFTLLGIMCLKVSVYLQPFTDKLFKKLIKKGG